MKFGIVLYSNDSETVWNALKLGIFALKEGDQVSTFVLAKGVECESIDTEAFNVSGKIDEFVEKGGKIMACGTCLKMRELNGSAHCPQSSMKDLYQMIGECDKIVTF